VGQQIKIKNLKFNIVGVTVREGESFLGTPSKDYGVIIPYDAFRKLYQTGTGQWFELGSDIGLKGRETDIGLVELESEARGLMRVKRGLKPIMKDNVCPEQAGSYCQCDQWCFDVLSIAGWIIGGFSMLVGALELPTSCLFL
jgi:putative ABC transport system permease protein